MYRQPILNETANFVNKMPSLNSPSLEIKDWNLVRTTRTRGAVTELGPCWAPHLEGCVSHWAREPSLREAGRGTSPGTGGWQVSRSDGLGHSTSPHRRQQLQRFPFCRIGSSRPSLWEVPGSATPTARSGVFLSESQVAEILLYRPFWCFQGSWGQVFHS